MEVQHEGSRPDRALPNDSGVREGPRMLGAPCSLQPDRIRLFGDHHQADPGQDRPGARAQQMEGGYQGDLRGDPGLLHQGALQPDSGVRGAVDGAVNLLGPLHVGEGDRPLAPNGSGANGPAVVPVIGTAGAPDVELLPAERDHGLSLGAAVNWTQRQIGSLLRPEDRGRRSIGAPGEMERDLAWRARADPRLGLQTRSTRK